MQVRQEEFIAATSRTHNIRRLDAAVGGSMARHPSHILELARKGAEHRHQELKEQLAELVKAFPYLEFGSSAGPWMPKQTYVPVKQRKRRRMSPAARRAVSRRMKKYWAARRAGRKK
jgi:hypothetical protein